MPRNRLLFIEQLLQSAFQGKTSITASLSPERVTKCPAQSPAYGRAWSRTHTTTKYTTKSSASGSTNGSASESTDTPANNCTYAFGCRIAPRTFTRVDFDNSIDYRNDSTEVGYSFNSQGINLLQYFCGSAQPSVDYR
jgi:hypothetical protein